MTIHKQITYSILLPDYYDTQYQKLSESVNILGIIHHLCII